MNSVILLRHGKTKSNLAKAYCGHTDVPLCPEGLAELNALKAQAQYPSCEGYEVLTSGLRRANETLLALYGALPFREVAAFREMHFGLFENKSYEELKEREDYQTWIAGDVTKHRPPGGESAEEMAARVYARFEELTNGDEKRLLIVSHGGPIAFLMTRLFPDAGKRWYEFQPQHGRGYMVELDGTKALTYRPIPEEH